MATKAGSGRRRATGLALAVSDWPVFWGIAASFLFYGMLPLLPDGQRAFALRYFAGQWVAYAESGLFFVAVALLVKRAQSLGRDRRALRFAEETAGLDVPTASLPADLHEALPADYHDTVIAGRLREAAEHLRLSRPAGTLGDTLRHLAELAAERRRSVTGLHRNICLAIPILGALGTLFGFASAFGGADPRSPGNVTAGLATAFDPTAVGLGLCLLLVFAGSLIDRAEQSVLDRAEAFGRKRLAPLGPSVPASPIVEAETRAASQLVERTDALIRTQTEAWQGAIESMRRRWAGTLIAQQGQLRDSLAAGMQLTLTDHAAGLKAAREELVSAVGQCTDRLETTVGKCTDRLERSLVESDRERARQLEAFSSDLRSLWDRCRGDLDDMQERYRETLAEAVSAVGSDLRSWRDELRQTNEAARGDRAELSRQTELLVRVTEQSAELSQFEGRLTANLESLRATETLQGAVHSLTAAAHLLTARTNGPWSRAA